jgi:hypothetical protein
LVKQLKEQNEKNQKLLWTFDDYLKKTQIERNVRYDEHDLEAEKKRKNQDLIIFKEDLDDFSNWCMTFCRK